MRQKQFVYTGKFAKFILISSFNPTQSGESLENKDVLESFENILEIVNQCETLTSAFLKDGKIENAADYLMDAQILKMSHDLLGSTAEKMGNSEFCENEYIAALTNIFTIDNGEHNFEKLSEIAIKCCKSSQASVSLLGTFDLDAGPRPEKVRKEVCREKKSLGPMKAPTSITQLSKSKQGAGKINIVRCEVQRVCHERQTDLIPYYELMCDPKDFMKSVDVAFQISFLVRDGFLGLKQINGEPHIFLYNPDPNSTQHNQREHSSDTVQCVMSLSPFVWKEKIEKYKIKSALLQLGDAGEDEEEEQEEHMEVDSDD